VFKPSVFRVAGKAEIINLFAVLSRQMMYKSGMPTESQNPVRIAVGGAYLPASQIDQLRQEASALLVDSDLSDRLAGEIPVMAHGTDEEATLLRLLDVVGGRTQVGFERMRRPPAMGLRGRILEAVRRVLWGLMRWPHDWLAFQQNAVNEQVIRLLTLEVQARRREAAALRLRLDALQHEVERLIADRPGSEAGGMPPC